jgi:glycosyltransferase involved in cell wall biosynthesis
MKNMHVLPTEKPSRLCLDSKDKLWFAKNSGYTIADGKVNIYITSDEEIKEGDWVIYTKGIIHCQKMDYKKDLLNVEEFDAKKIILTTDQDLIKDGVQAIDDDFLEWFVKNPSCEKVYFRLLAKLNKSTKKYEDFWEIHIPKEEVKKLHEMPLAINNITMSCASKPKQETFKNYPVIIVRNDDKEEFIHLSNGMYRTKWGILHDSISSTPLESFDKSKFTFYYE